MLKQFCVLVKGFEDISRKIHTDSSVSMTDSLVSLTPQNDSTGHGHHTESNSMVLLTLRSFFHICKI